MASNNVRTFLTPLSRKSKLGRIGCLWLIFIAGQTVEAAKNSSAMIRPKVIEWRQVGEWPHDSGAFTQGLEVWDDKYFLESTGQYGRSEIRRVERTTGKVVSKSSLDAQLFGEGVTRVGGKILQLTWREGVILSWQFSPKKGFDLRSRESWVGEGWGLTSGGGRIWASDGSSRLVDLDPKTLKVKRSIKVTLGGEAFDRLNELEYVNGKILANVYMSSTVVRIDPKTGAIDGMIDLSPLVPKGISIEAVANGMAWDGKSKRLYVTGKLWPKVFELELKGI